MLNVKIIGAGSIGNHLAYTCREQGWAVTMCDIDAAALKRTREDIYLSRYGQWDESIRLCRPKEAVQYYDLVIIGTPPDSHIPLALDVLRSNPPRILLIEKPLCPPSLEGMPELDVLAAERNVRVLVGYNHRMTEHTRIASEWLSLGLIGYPLTLNAMTREHWGGIFEAHPWLAGPSDSYLGFTDRGGGALCEHSHAINIWQYFSTLAGTGHIQEVSCMLDEVMIDGAAYDRVAQLSVRTDGGLVGTIVQDVVTRPACKWLRLEAAKGYVEWQVNVDDGHDLARMVIHGGEVREKRIAKTRPDDFRGEIAHVSDLLQHPDMVSPLDLSSGMETMEVIAAALASARTGRTVHVERATRHAQ